MFKIVDFVHFFVDLQPIRPKFENNFLFEILDEVSFLYSENDVYTIMIYTEKALYQNVGKTPFFVTFNVIPGFWSKTQKTAPKP